MCTVFFCLIHIILTVTAFSDFCTPKLQLSCSHFAFKSDHRSPRCTYFRSVRPDSACRAAAVLGHWQHSERGTGGGTDWECDADNDCHQHEYHHDHVHVDGGSQPISEPGEGGSTAEDGILLRGVLTRKVDEFYSEEADFSDVVLDLENLLEAGIINIKV